ncbi:MAG: hypothetical protein Q7S62_02065 [bacterium]|nr:hypothetical protein [bacterium]
MKYLLYVVIVLVAVLFLYYVGAFQPSEVPQEQWETKTDDQPPVTVTVTPLEFGADAQIWKFALVFDTHSGSLDDDPLAVVSLVDNKDNTYEPTAWEGPGPGGHHREGILFFEAVNPMPSYAELKIKNVGGIPERLFTWSIK